MTSYYSRTVRKRSLGHVLPQLSLDRIEKLIGLRSRCGVRVHFGRRFGRRRLLLLLLLLLLLRFRFRWVHQPAPNLQHFPLLRRRRLLLRLTCRAGGPARGQLAIRSAPLYVCA